MTTLHIYTANKKVRVRRKCPFHKHLCFGTLHEYYDTTKVFFYCGTVVDYGYGEYTPPRKYKRLCIFKDGDKWVLWARYVWQKLGEAKTHAGIQRLASYHLKPGGGIKEI